MKKSLLLVVAVGLGVLIGFVATNDGSSSYVQPRPEPELSVDEVTSIVPIDPITTIDRPLNSRLVNTGFNPMINGFSFANWGGLTSRDKMSYEHLVELIGGSAQCDEEGLHCHLRNGNLIELKHLNEHLSAGRCEGMIVLAALIFTGQYDLGQLSSTATNTIDLTRDQSADEIARWWATQLSPELHQFATTKRTLRPHEVAREVQVLMENRIMVSMGIYADGIAHTVLPFAAFIEPQKTTFLVYDPNSPLETKKLTVDFDTDVWELSNAYLSNGSIGTLSSSERGSLDYINITARNTAGGWQELVDF